MKVKAPVLFEQGKPLVVEDIELEEPHSGEVLVRMVASGVCRSCLNAADGSWVGIPLPIVLGDEGAGVVEAIGPGVSTVCVGDHVILSWSPSCGRCIYCLTERPILCENKPPLRRMADGTTRMSLRGQPVYHYGYVASFASYSVVHENSAIPIPRDVPLDIAALIGCSVTTGVCAVLNSARVPTGASMAVFGVGGVGLNMVQGGMLVSANPIIAVDVREQKLEYARQFGATHLVDASQEDPVAAIHSITRRGVDYAFVAAGDVDVMHRAWDSLAPGGTCVIAGIPATGAKLVLDAQRLVNTERRLVGTHYGSSRPRIDFPRLIDLYTAGRLKLRELITHRYSIHEVNEAFYSLSAGDVARALIVF